MGKKKGTYLADAREWLDKSMDPELDTKLLKLSLESAERAAREVDALKVKLEKASEEQRVAFLVLDETLKSVKHARKALVSRRKAEEKPAKAAEKDEKAGKSVEKTGKPPKKS